MEDNSPHESTTEPPDYTIPPRDHQTYRLIRYVLGFIEVLLAFRFMLKFLGANPSNLFAEIVYGISAVLILPFATIFPPAVSVDGGNPHAFEPSVVIAMIAYALIAWGIARLFLIFHSKPKS